MPITNNGEREIIYEQIVRDTNCKDVDIYIVKFSYLGANLGEDSLIKNIPVLGAFLSHLI